MKSKVIILSLVLTLILGIGLSIAYFTVGVDNNKGNLSINSKELKIIFTDDSSIASTTIIPGWSELKTFTIENKSNADYKYNIVFKDLVNTFVTTGYLQYKITSTKNGYITEGYIDIPKSSVPTDVVLAYDIVIPEGITQEYIVEFIYHNSEEDQSADMGKVLSGYLAIEEGTRDPNREYIVMVNVIGGSSKPNPQKIKYSEVATFTISPDILNTLVDSSVRKVSGDGMCNYNADTGILKISEPTSDVTCEINLPLKEKILSKRIIQDNGGSKKITIRSNSDLTIPQERENGKMYKSNYTNNGKYTYYFTGDVKNNWVKFGKDTNENDLWWRIIRVNEDGSVRLLYHGTGHDKQDATIGSIAWNTNNNNRGYVGLGYNINNSTYGDCATCNGRGDTLADGTESNTISGISPVLEQLYSWYKTNLNKPGTMEYINENTEYCNGRDVTASGPTVGYFASYTRMYLTSPMAPSFKCKNEYDKFSAFSSNLQTKLTYPIGLMTIDEVIFAGGIVNNGNVRYNWYVENSKQNNSVFSDFAWWTMSPYSINNNKTYMFGVYSITGIIADIGTQMKGEIRPVISLDSKVLGEGSGTTDDPYVVIGFES